MGQGHTPTEFQCFTKLEKIHKREHTMTFRSICTRGFWRYCSRSWPCMVKPIKKPRSWRTRSWDRRCKNTSPQNEGFEERSSLNSLFLKGIFELGRGGDVEGEYESWKPAELSINSKFNYESWLEATLFATKKPSHTFPGGFSHRHVRILEIVRDQGR